MNPLSMDLRELIVKKYQEGNTSYTKLANFFKVSWSTVQRLVFKANNNVGLEPKPASGGPKKKIDADYLLVLKSVALEKPDLTLDEYREIMKEKTIISISSSSMSRALEMLKLTRKKKTFTRQKERHRK